MDNERDSARDAPTGVDAFGFPMSGNPPGHGSGLLRTTSTLIAQLTDTHVVERDTDEMLYVDNNGRALAAVQSINGERPAVDAVIATGDLTQWGRAAEYEVLAEIFGGLVPTVLPLPGNHDDRSRLRTCFADHDWADAEHASWVAMVGPVRIIGLDTTMPGEAGGAFDPEREAWLESSLAQSHDGVTILAMHHPPFPSGIAWMDAAGFAGLDRLIAVVAAVGTVDKIVCGHVHRPISSSVVGVPAEVGLSTAVHVALDLEPAGPVRVVRDPPGYRLHVCQDRSVVSHTRYTTTNEQPFIPDWAVETGID